MRKLLLLFFLFLICHAAFSQTGNIAIENATVIDMSNGKLIRNQTILIEGNKIISVKNKTDVPGNATIIDAKGKYVIPGLWDMHTHAFSDRRFEWVFPLLIANGVTGVRELGTSMSFDSINLITNQVIEGKLLGPRFGAVTQLVFNGNTNPNWPFMAVTDPNDARRLVKLYKQQGMSFIKVYNTLSREVLQAIVDEARIQGLPVLGHVPIAITVTEASDLGFISLEHGIDILVSCSGDETQLRNELDTLPKNLSPASGRRQHVEFKAVQSFDEKKATDLFKRFVRNGTSICPTLAIHARSVKTTDELAKDDRMKYMPKQTRDRWYTQMSQANRPQTDDKQKVLLDKRISILGLMQRSGVNILAGTDFPNPYIYPGFSMHDELELFVQGGLTPLQALQSATINAAKFLHKEKETGTVEKGKLADLIILDANPLEQISNSKKIFAVIANGRLFERKDLDNLLDGVYKLLN
jgi:imidazolonepropionase-like amidohydrolase